MKQPHLLRWSYGTGLEARYQAGRALQSCDPSRCDWQRELQLDLRAATARADVAVSCVVANGDTWYALHLLFMNRRPNDVVIRFVFF